MLNKSILKISIALLSAVAVLIYFCISSENYNSGSYIKPGEIAEVEKKQVGALELISFLYADIHKNRSKHIDTDNISETDIAQVPIISNVYIDKKSVCAGEEFAVSVETDYSESPDLAVRIGPESGNPVVLRFAAPGEREFYVTVRDENMNVDLQKITIEVLDCGDKYFASLSANLSPMNPDEVEYEVSIPENKNPVRYEWDFGDGRSAVTHRGFVIHNYGLREQKSFQSSFKTEVRIIYEDGESETASASVAFPNLHYISSLMGEPLVPVFYERFAETGVSSYYCDLVFQNIYNEHIKFTHIELAYRPCSGSDSLKRGTIPAGSIMSDTEIYPSSKKNVSLGVPLPSYSGEICNLTVNIKGEMSDGRQVASSVYLNVLSRQKAPDDIVVNDEKMIEKLNRAREILGDGPITPNNITQLEKDGFL